MTELEQKQAIEKLAQKFYDSYIDEWGDAPECLYLNAAEVESFKRVGISNALCGVPIITTSKVNHGEFRFAGNVGERH